MVNIYKAKESNVIGFANIDFCQKKKRKQNKQYYF